MAGSAEQPAKTAVVSSYNEWAPLEEVIVGVLDGASIPPWHVQLQATMPTKHWGFFQTCGGRPFPEELIAVGKRDLEEFVHLLEAEGVKVRRPQVVDFSRPYRTLDWECVGGLYEAMPRDVLLVIGKEIIEAPMAWRSRFFEINAYRPLLREYFRGGRWTAAPKPQMSDQLYDYDYAEPQDGEQPRYSITEFEPTFDAADFMRCGRDIFVQRSNCTNAFGIEWLRRHLGDTYEIHELQVRDAHPMHIDATFMPLAPGKLLVNKERLPKTPPMFKGWDILEAPEPTIPDDHPMYMCSKWVSMNVLMLDEERVIVEKYEEPTIRALREWGLKPILCGFRSFNSFGGSFHCAALDIRRRGELRSYF